MSTDVNLQTQATDQAYMGTVSDADGVSADTQIGNLDGQNVAIDKSSDPTTKDDEVASNIKAEKDTQKAIKKDKAKEEEKEKKLKNVQASEDTKYISEQQQQGKRISKQTEARLRVINENTQEDLQNTINQRSYSLFSGSEDKYLKCCNKFNELLDQDADNIKTFKTLIKPFETLIKESFDDVAEQHNALQIINDVWERKLTNLQKLADEIKEKSIGEDGKESEEQKNDYEQIQQQVTTLKKNIKALCGVQVELMLENGNRIEDSYKLAPLLREVSANMNHDISLPPKKFNELILDKILPHKGEPVKTFECLCENLIENNKAEKNTSEAIACFENNLVIIGECLKQELKTCPDPKISFAIVNVCRTAEKLESIQNYNKEIIDLTSRAFAS